MIAKVNADLAKVITQPDVHQQFVFRGDEPFAGTPDQAGAYLKSEIAKWRRVIREANIRTD